MNYKEASMSAPIQKWLEDKGYTFYCEVPHYYSSIDVVGKKEDEIITIEMKTSLTWKVIEQGRLSGRAATYAYVAILSKPKKKGVEECKQSKLGILRVVNDKVVVLLEAPKLEHSIFGRKELRLDLIEPGGTGGLPQPKGVGPAQDVWKQIKEYRKNYPNASWKELYEEIPNHYSGHSNMQNSMRMLLERLNI